MNGIIQGKEMLFQIVIERNPMESRINHIRSFVNRHLARSAVSYQNSLVCDLDYLLSELDRKTEALKEIIESCGTYDPMYTEGIEAIAKKALKEA